MTETRTCKLCGGTGAMVLMNSWFTRDGCRKSRCGVCAGAGISSYEPAPDYVKDQARLREQFSRQERGTSNLT